MPSLPGVISLIHHQNEPSLCACHHFLATTSRPSHRCEVCTSCTGDQASDCTAATCATSDGYTAGSFSTTSGACTPTPNHCDASEPSLGSDMTAIGTDGCDGTAAYATCSHSSRTACGIYCCFQDWKPLPFSSVESTTIFRRGIHAHFQVWRLTEISGVGSALTSTRELHNHAQGMEYTSLHTDGSNL